MYFNIIRAWKNYIFTLDCFKILVNDPPTRELYNLKYTSGLMYTAIFIDKEIKGDFIQQSLVNKMAILDEKMAVMNMVGLFNVRFDFIGDGKIKDKHYYRIIFIPIYRGKIIWWSLVHLIGWSTAVLLVIKFWPWLSHLIHR